MMKDNRSKWNLLEQCAALMVTLLLSSSVLAESQPNPDPYEKYNRVAFHFNDALDTYLLKPTARAYNTILPDPARTSINNFFNNINTIPIVLNDVLQANFYQATSDSWRLFINSTIGVFGLFDVASKIGLEPNQEEDLGLTFAQWGWKKSNFFVIPFLGPSTIRDTLAKPIEYQYMSIYPYISSTEDMYALYGLGVVNSRAQLLKLEKVMRQAAIDKYVFQRNAFMQHRAYLIQRNKELASPYLYDDIPNSEDDQDTSYLEVNA